MSTLASSVVIALLSAMFSWQCLKGWFHRDAHGIPPSWAWLWCPSAHCALIWWSHQLDSSRHAPHKYRGHIINLPQDIATYAETPPRCAKALDVSHHCAEAWQHWVTPWLSCHKSVVLFALFWLLNNNIYYRNISLGLRYNPMTLIYMIIMTETIDVIPPPPSHWSSTAEQCKINYTANNLPAAAPTLMIQTGRQHPLSVQELQDILAEGESNFPTVCSTIFLAGKLGYWPSPRSSSQTIPWSKLQLDRNKDTTDAATTTFFITDVRRSGLHSMWMGSGQRTNADA